MAAPDPAPVHMDHAQLQLLIAGVRGGGNRKRTVPFKTPDGLEWQTWRRQFEHIARGNGWTNGRARNEIASALEGEAARVVEDIPIEDAVPAGAVDAPAFGLLLDAYEARFITVGDEDSAKVVFRTSKQKPDENLVAWHARARQLFRRAYPALDAAAVEASDVLVDKFVRGLYNPAVMEYTMDHRPATYGDALTNANTKAATLRSLKSVIKKGLRGEPPGGGIFAFGDKADFSCYFCNKEGHMQRSCPEFLKAVKEFQQSRNKKSSFSGKKSQRSAGDSKKKPYLKKKSGMKKKRSLNAMGEEEEEEGSDENGESGKNSGSEEEEQEGSEGEENDASETAQGN